MRLKIDSNTAAAIKNLKNHILFYRGEIMVIKGYTIAEEKHIPKKTLFNRKPKEVTDLILMDIKIKTYNTNAKSMGQFTDEGAEFIIQYSDLYESRNRWLKFKEQLNAFGITLSKEEEI